MWCTGVLSRVANVEDQKTRESDCIEGDCEVVISVSNSTGLSGDPFDLNSSIKFKIDRQLRCECA